MSSLRESGAGPLKCIWAVMILSLFLCLLTSPVLGQNEMPAGFEIEAPSLALSGIRFDVTLTAVDSEGQRVESYNGTPKIEGVGSEMSSAANVSFSQGRLVLRDIAFKSSGSHELKISEGSVAAQKGIRVIPGFFSLLPPIVAITLALIFRQVVVALFAGIWLGAIFIFDYQFVGGFFRVLDHFIVNVLTERNQVQIIVFSFLFGGMVGVITQNGGAKGIANLITRYARTARGGQIAAWGMAFFLFFDDYSNVLIRGNLMRPITDRLRVSREKLAFIVDAGAATVASIFIISTWIGYEVGLIEQGLRMIGSDQSAYTLFVRTIPYRFYPILTLILVFLVAWMGRDFGPMLTAERRARLEGKVLRDDAEPATDLIEAAEGEGAEVPARWVNGFFPVLTILVVGMLGLYMTGVEALQAKGTTSYGIGEIISSADSYLALLWASLSGCVVAIGLTLVQRLLPLSRTMEAWVQGLKSMMLAMLILILAWALGAVTAELHTADYLVQALRGVLSPFWLPALTFIVAAAVAFSTGTSWATMAIMMPLVIPLANTLGTDAGLGAVELDRILLGVVSSVLAGAVFGDHCSPISDTTILSSMASACDHIDHVRTQLPYALVVAVVGIIIGDIPTAYGLPPWISILLGTAVLIAVLLLVGKKVVPDEAQVTQD